MFSAVSFSFSSSLPSLIIRLVRVREPQSAYAAIPAAGAPPISAASGSTRRTPCTARPPPATAAHVSSAHPGGRRGRTAVLRARRVRPTRADPRPVRSRPRPRPRGGARARGRGRARALAVGARGRVPPPAPARLVRRALAHAAQPARARGRGGPSLGPRTGRERRRGWRGGGAVPRERSVLKRRERLKPELGGVGFSCSWVVSACRSLLVGILLSTSSPSPHGRSLLAPYGLPTSIRTSPYVLLPCYASYRHVCAHVPCSLSTSTFTLTHVPATYLAPFMCL